MNRMNYIDNYRMPAFKKLLGDGKVCQPVSGPQPPLSELTDRAMTKLKSMMERLGANEMDCKTYAIVHDGKVVWDAKFYYVHE